MDKTLHPISIFKIKTKHPLGVFGGIVWTITFHNLENFSNSHQDLSNEDSNLILTALKFGH